MPRIDKDEYPNQQSTQQSIQSQQQPIDHVKSFTFHGVEVGNLSGTNIQGDCPFCKSVKFYINRTNGLWDCKVCSKSGNLYQFLSELWNISKQEMSDNDYEELAEEKTILYPETLKTWGLAKSILNDEWIVPTWNVEGKLNNLCTYRPDPKTQKNRFWNTPTCNATIFGRNLYNEKKPTAYIAEGIWDACALWELSDKNSVNVIAVPGANVFNSRWVSLFQGKDVSLLYDNDLPRIVEGRRVEGAGLSGTKRAVKILLEGETNSNLKPPKSIQYLQWGKEGYNPKLPDGYDLRDALAKGKTFMDRKELWEKLSILLTSIPNIWKSTAITNASSRASSSGSSSPGNNGKHTATESKEPKRDILPIECSSWKEVEEEWKKALRLRQSMTDALTTMFAVCASTSQVGDQLFLQVIGQPGGGKCLGAGTEILMYDGTIKDVEDIKVGDLLVGPDSTPRKVLTICTGREMLYKITPIKGDPYIVNESHILSLRVSRSVDSLITGSYMKGEIVNISVKDYLKKNTTFKKATKGWRTGVDWKYKFVSINPYFLGLWLGDGDSVGPVISTTDQEIVDFLRWYADYLGLQLKNHEKSGQCPRYSLSTIKGTQNGLLNYLRREGVIRNKHIPKDYLVNDRETRLQLLAGLLDSDGSYHHGGFVYSSVLKRLASDVTFLCRSLGLAAYMTSCINSCQTGVVGTYWKVLISGDCSIIPTRLPRKKASRRKQIKNVLNTGIKVQRLDIGDYYGFTLDKDSLFLLGDFTVTHNTRFCEGLLVSKRCKLLEHMTGFHSGFKGEEGGEKDYSLVNRINHMTLITPEADIMMSSPKYEEIMSQQRRMFDGSTSASYKNQDHEREYTALRTPWIMAGTPALLDRDQSRLGDRFLKIIIEPPTEEEKDAILMKVGYTAIRSLMQVSTKAASYEESILTAYRKTGGYVDYLRDNVVDLLTKLQPNVDEEKIVRLCSIYGQFAADLRARPNSDYSKKESHDTKEMPTRLTHQFVRLAYFITVVLNKSNIDEEVLRIVKKVAIDTCSGRTMNVVNCLYIRAKEGKHMGAEALGIWTGESEGHEKKLLSFMSRMGIIEGYKVEGQGYKWKLTKRFKTLYEQVMV